MTEKQSKLDLVARVAARLDSGVQAPTSEPGAATPSLAVPIAAAASAASPPEQAPAAPAPPEVHVDRPVAAVPKPEAEHHSSPHRAPALNIDFAALHHEGFLTPDNLRSVIAEEFRVVKRPLLRVAEESRAVENGLGHVIMVTSPRPGDGKTFVSINLAFSVASERDLFVLLIDGDIRKRGLTRKLGLMDRPGIMEVLTNPKLSISDVMVRTSIPNLAIIPTGKPIDSATELFASQRMATLMRDVGSRYKDRIIIFDAPPTLAASEAGVLALHVGQIVFVVSSGDTSKRSIADSVRLLDACPNLSFVINRASNAGNKNDFGTYGY